jgi:hypothetical protein
MQEITLTVCVVALAVFFFSPWELRMDEDEV